jgi:hypothetical protein
MLFPMRFFSFVLCLFPVQDNTLLAQITGETAAVQFSQRGGLFVASVGVALSCPTPDAVIRYTLDGSVPDIQSAIYANTPFTFDTTSVLRARAFANGLPPSPLTTHTYFVGAAHTFPVVSLAFEPAAFFDSLAGIYVNYTQDLNAVANVEFFEPATDTAAFNQLVEVEIQGTGSASQPQKSLEIKAKNALGLGDVQHAVFPDLPFEQYKRFVLRNGGQDWCVMQFRDEFATSLLSDCSDLDSILQQPALHLQAWRPSVVYLNGQYWGIHNLRERMNRFYVRQHFDWDQDEFDMIENYGDVSSGDSIAWFQLFNYLWQTESGFEDDAVFENLKRQIDYQNFIDYCAFNIYLENEDWPGNNVLRFRHRNEDGKWRWMTYDLDFTFGLYQPNGGWNTGDPSPNALARLLDDTTLVWPNPDWATLLFRRCWQNASFRRDFANRLADMLNTAFIPQRVSKRLDEFRTLYQPEITQHFVRWWFGNYDALWLQNIETTRHFASNRPSFVHQEILQSMAEAYDAAELTVDVFPPGGGRVVVSTVRPNGTQLPWTGTYFKGVPLPVKAVANPGYTFTGWSKPELGTADSVGLLLMDSILLVAHFQLTDTTITDTSESMSLSFNIFPNPTTGNLTVYGAMFKQNAVQVQVRNGLGQVLSDAYFAPNTTGQIFMEMPVLPAGVYFLKMTVENGEAAVRKFVLHSH